MLLAIFCLLILSSFTSVSCSSSYQTFTDIAISLELLTGHVKHLRGTLPGETLGKELLQISSAVEKFKRALYAEKLMVFHCGHYDGDDELYGEVLRLYQHQRKNPWISSISIVLNKSIFSKNYGPLYEAMHKKDFRAELRQLLDEGKNIFIFQDESKLVGVKQSLLKRVVELVQELVESKIKASTGVNINFNDINLLLETSYPIPTYIRTMPTAKDIYNNLPTIEFRFKYD